MGSHVLRERVYISPIDMMIDRYIDFYLLNKNNGIMMISKGPVFSNDLVVWRY